MELSLILDTDPEYIKTIQVFGLDNEMKTWVVGSLHKIMRKKNRLAHLRVRSKCRVVNFENKYIFQFITEMIFEEKISANYLF